MPHYVKISRATRRRRKELGKALARLRLERKRKVYAEKIGTEERKLKVEICESSEGGTEYFEDETIASKVIPPLSIIRVENRRHVQRFLESPYWYTAILILVAVVEFCTLLLKILRDRPAQHPVVSFGHIDAEREHELRTYHMESQLYRVEGNERKMPGRWRRCIADHTYSKGSSLLFDERDRDCASQTLGPICLDVATQCSRPSFAPKVQSLPPLKCSSRLCNKSRYLIARFHENHRLRDPERDSLRRTAQLFGIGRNTVKLCVKKYGTLCRYQGDLVGSEDASPAAHELPPCRS
ncbi:hypothetical protein AB6A40_010628 [Gnathostoma spinigerum]|uniref:Uncharacterized protein n=1 Tax=Gnathostoma spinigerum TaxID=75299 RepID=A0ABD6F070_9BILA